MQLVLRGYWVDGQVGHGDAAVVQHGAASRDAMLSLREVMVSPIRQGRPPY